MKRLSPLFFVGLVIVIGALVVSQLPGVVTVTDYPSGGLDGPTGSEAGSASATVTVTSQAFNQGTPAYDLPYSFISDGSTLDEIQLSLFWYLTGENVDWDSLNIHFTMTASLVQDSENETLHIEEWTSSVRSDGLTLYYDLELLLDDYQTVDGSVDFDLVAEFTLNDNEGAVLDETINYGISVTVYTDPATSSLEVVEIVRVTNDLPNNRVVIAYSAVGGSLNPIENPLIAVIILGIMFLVFGIYLGRRS